jgi:hypothetical protein
VNCLASALRAKCPVQTTHAPARGDFFRLAAAAQIVPFFIGKRYRGSFDSRHEIPEKPADSPEARFDGEMVAPPCSIPGNRHAGNSPSGGAASVRCRFERKGSRRAPLGLHRGFAAKIGGAGGLKASIPLRSAAC